MTDFDELLARAQAKEIAVEQLEVVVAGEVVTLEFTEVPVDEWSTITAKHPPRMDVAIDRTFQYNYHAASTESLVKFGTRIEGDERVNMSAEKWAALLGALSPWDRSRLFDVVWGMNEWEPYQRTQDVKKASARASK